MGGIKNKLSKLSNKVKLLLFLPLDRSSATGTTPPLRKGAPIPPFRKRRQMKSDRISIGGVNKQDLLDKVNNKGSRLPSFSQPSKMPDGQISNTRKLSHLGLYASKTIGSLRPTSQSLPLAKGRQMSVAHRWGRITKYLGIACLSLAIVSTLILNIISSYSNSSTRSNAEPVSNSSTSALANTANTELDPTGISISISPYPSSSSTGSNDSNLSLSIPQGGGIATGRHTVSVNVGINVQGYNIAVSSDTASLVNNIGEHRSVIESVSAQMGKWSGGSGRWTGVQLGNLQWGMAIPDRDASYTDDSGGIWQFYPYQYSGLYDTTDQTQLAKSTWTAVPIGDEQGVIFEQSNAQPATIDIYYGARVNSPSTMLAGNYTAGVVYTVVAELYPEPAVTSIANPNEGNSNNVRVDTTSQTITIHGSNLDTASKVYVDDRGTDRECTLIGSPTSASLTCTLPTLSTVGDNYHVIVETKGGSAYGTINVIPPIPTIISISPSEINADSDNEILTVTGTNLATTSDIYVDFSNMQVMDDGEECVIDQSTITDTEVKCTAPRHSASNTLPVGLVTKGGVAYKTNAVKYVESLSVTRVSPSGICASMKGYTATFTIYGAVLDEVTDVVIVGDSRLAPMLESTCDITSNIGSQITCRTTWQYGDEYTTEPQMTMKLYDGSEELYTINDFVLVNPC